MAYAKTEMTQFDTVFGRNLLAEVPNFVAPPIVVVTMADLWPIFRDQLPADAEIYTVVSMERQRLEQDLAQLEGAASIVGLGGGQAIDAAKYFSWRTALPLFQFPTCLSVDAVFGHRASVRENCLVRYIGWAVPESIYIDFGIIKSAPRHLNLGGLGDVFCFITGVMDWRYAHKIGRCEAKWPFDEELAAISLSKAEAAIEAMDDISSLTPRGIQIMVDALRWGGASYHAAGWNPRHIEGVEHFIFYALEASTGRKFLHGQAVCLGLILGCMMHGERADEMLHIVREVDIDIRPEAMGITWNQVDGAMKTLKTFVREEKLPYGIAHDFNVTDEFLVNARARIEEVYGPWTK